MTQEFTIKHVDEFDKDGKWLLARRSLGVKSFGMNVFELKPGEDIPEHTEVGRDQEEVFIVLEGAPKMVVNGTKYDTKPGTYIRVDVDPMRYMVNESDKNARVLIVSAPKTSGYEPLNWA